MVSVNGNNKKFPASGFDNSTSTQQWIFCLKTVHAITFVQAVNEIAKLHEIY